MKFKLASLLTLASLFFIGAPSYSFAFRFGTASYYPYSTPYFTPFSYYPYGLYPVYQNIYPVYNSVFAPYPVLDLYAPMVSTTWIPYSSDIFLESNDAVVFKTPRALTFGLAKMARVAELKSSMPVGEEIPDARHGSQPCDLTGVTTSVFADSQNSADNDYAEKRADKK